MKKADYQAAVRSKLREVPVETRRAWNETSLLTWWLRTHRENPHLTWDGGSGDPWQRIPGICRDLIGQNAD